MAELKAIKYHPGKLEVLNQLRLPHVFRYDGIKTCEDAFNCIRTMKVRGESGSPVTRCLCSC